MNKNASVTVHEDVVHNVVTNENMTEPVSPYPSSSPHTDEPSQLLEKLIEPDGDDDYVDIATADVLSQPNTVDDQTSSFVRHSAALYPISSFIPSLFVSV